MRKPVDVEKHRNNYLQFVKGRNVLILSMLDDEGKPFSSCAPFVKKNDKLYIYISQVAEHYHFLEQNNDVDVLLIGDELTTKNAFATERVRWRCKTKNIGNDGNEAIFDLLKEQSNTSLIDMLRGLDFSLFELTPVQGRYVVGFGLAFDLNLDGSKFVHVVVDKENKAGAKA